MNQRNWGVPPKMYAEPPKKPSIGERVLSGISAALGITIIGIVVLMLASIVGSFYD